MKLSIFVFALYTSAALASAWNQVPKKFQDWISANLVSSEKRLDAESLSKLFKENEPREICHISASLFFRNREHDRVNAKLILSSLLKRQHVRPGHISNGDWRLLDGSFNPYHNNRRFMGVCLIQIREEFFENADYQERRPLNEALKILASGEMLRKPLLRSSNLPFMQVFILSYLGNLFGEQDWKERGEGLAQAIYQDIKKHNVMMEFNSPTYDGVSLYVLRHWIKYGSSQLSSMGTDLQNFLWNEILSLYHPDLKNMAGPYSRNYSLNMRHYLSMLGLWFGVVTEDFDFGTFSESRYSHILPLLFSLGHGLVQDKKSRLFQFEDNETGVRIVRKLHPQNSRILGREMQTTSIIHKDFMYGYAKGFDSGKMNHFPFLAHWKKPQDEKVFWLNISGRPNNINVVEVEDGYLSVSFEKIPMNRNSWDYFIAATFRQDADDPAWTFENNILSINGKRIEIRTKLGAPRVRVYENNRFGKRMVSLRWIFDRDDHDKSLMRLKFLDEI